MLFTPLREWGEAGCVVHSIKRMASQKGSDLNALVCNSKFNSKTNYAVVSKTTPKYRHITQFLQQGMQLCCSNTAG